MTLRKHKHDAWRGSSWRRTLSTTKSSTDLDVVVGTSNNSRSFPLTFKPRFGRITALCLRCGVVVYGTRYRVHIAHFVTPPGGWLRVFLPAWYRRLVPNLLIVSRKQYHRYDFLKRFSSIQISGSVPDMLTTLPLGQGIRASSPYPCTFRMGLPDSRVWFKWRTKC